MSLQENTRQLNRIIARNLLLTARFVMKRMPYPFFRVLRYLFMVLGRPVMLKKRKLVMKNLHIAFGESQSSEELKKIAVDCFNNFGKEMVDLVYLVDRPKEILQKVSFEGKDHLDQALQNGKGAIVVSAHFGNFILMYLRTILEGYPINVIMRRTRDEAFEKYISDFRNERNIKTIYDFPLRKCVQQSIKALRNNELLFILLDQNYGSEGRVFVDFFGHKAATAAGPVVFANRTKAPILPMFIMHDSAAPREDHRRVPGGRQKIVIEPPVPLEEGEDSQKTLVENVERVTKVIERYIRDYPHEWGGWMHNRWKTKES